MATSENLKNEANDIAILQFIMKQKKKEVNEEDQSLESVSAINEIIVHNFQNKDLKEERNSNHSNDVIFDIDEMYNKYHKQILEINEKKKGLLNKMELVDEKEIIEREQTMKNSLLVNFGLIIEGDSIAHFVSPELEKLSWKLVNKCRSIICCRCNPQQKSEIVKYVKDNTSEIVLSIGDGDNDVNMIKVISIKLLL